MNLHGAAKLAHCMPLLSLPPPTAWFPSRVFGLRGLLVSTVAGWSVFLNTWSPGAQVGLELVVYMVEDDLEPLSLPRAGAASLHHEAWSV